MSYYVNPHGHQCTWYPYSELLGYPSSNWCEANSCYLMSEPINATSSLSFLVVALVLTFIAKKKDHPDLKLKINFLLLSGVSLSLFHVANNFALEVLSVTLLLLFMLVGFFKNLNRRDIISYRSQKKFLIFTAILAIGFEFLLYKFFINIFILIPLFLLVLIVSDLWAKKKDNLDIDYKYLTGAFLIVVISTTLNVLDTQKILCFPNTYFQARSLAYILEAIAFGMIFMHFLQMYKEKEQEHEIDFTEYSDEENEDETEDDRVKNIPQFDTMVDPEVAAQYLDEDEVLNEDIEEVTESEYSEQTLSELTKTLKEQASDKDDSQADEEENFVDENQITFDFDTPSDEEIITDEELEEESQESEEESQDIDEDENEDSEDKNKS